MNISVIWKIVVKISVDLILVWISLYSQVQSVVSMLSMISLIMMFGVCKSKGLSCNIRQILVCIIMVLQKMVDDGVGFFSVLVIYGVNGSCVDLVSVVSVKLRVISWVLMVLICLLLVSVVYLKLFSQVVVKLSVSRKLVLLLWLVMKVNKVLLVVIGCCQVQLMSRKEVMLYIFQLMKVSSLLLVSRISWILVMKKFRMMKQ